MYRTRTSRMYVLLHPPIQHTLYLFHFLVPTTSLLLSTNRQGFNPMIHFTFSPTSNHTDIYQVTQEGLLIAMTNELKPEQKHFLEVSLSQWKHLFKFNDIKEQLVVIFCVMYTLCQSSHVVSYFQIIPDNIV